MTIDKSRKLSPWRVAVIAIAGTAAFMAAYIWYTSPRRKQRNFDPQKFHAVRRVREFPPLTSFDIKSLADLKPGEIRDEELVLGVEIDGQARAYLINTLTGPIREIFNDELGGAAIAATW